MTLILCFVGRHGALAIFMSMWFFFVSAMRYLCSFFLFSRNLSCSRSVHDRIGLIYLRTKAWFCAVFPTSSEVAECG